MLVVTLFVRLLNMSIPLIIENFPNIFFVSKLRSLLNFLTYFWVFWYDLLVVERLTERNTINNRHRHVDELRPLVVAYIIIADVSVSLSLDPNFELFFGKAFIDKIITDTNNSILNEIHVRHFVFFIQNKSLTLALIKVLWSETKAHIIEELLRSIPCWVEEILEFENDIVEQIMDHYVSFHSPWALI